MRQSLVIVLTGLVAGTVGALVAGRMTATGAAPTIVSVRPRPPAPVIVPAGWDQGLSVRLGEVEKELATQRAATTVAATDKPALSSDPSEPPIPLAQREQERAQHYQKEIAYHEQLLSQHAQEAIDRAWSSDQGQAVRQAFDAQPAAAADGPRPDNVQVDCRSKTCVAKLTFPTSFDGLRYLHAAHVPMPPGCNGMTSTPLPPRDDGAYDLNVIYICRK